MIIPERISISHFEEIGYQLRGVVHVGANDGREVHYYLDHQHTPILCFEPHPVPVARALQAFAGNPLVHYVIAALGDVDGELEMLVPADGDTEKTSKYRPVPTPGHPWTEVPPGSTITVPVRRFDHWAMENGFDSNLFDTLVVDAQGMELEVLGGFGIYLDRFNFLVVELSRTPVYEGEAPAVEVAAWLEEHGFRRDMEIQEHEDVQFVRQGL